MNEQLTDPREIRKHLMNVSYNGDRIDGAQAPRISSPAANLTRQVRHVSEAQGFSGEDAMTVLAYHALLQYEKLYDMLLDQSMLNTRPNPYFSNNSTFDFIWPKIDA